MAVITSDCINGPNHLGSVESEEIIERIAAMERSRVQDAEQTLEGKITTAVLSSIGVLQVTPRHTAAIPVGNPYCSCKLTRAAGPGGGAALAVGGAGRVLAVLFQAVGVLRRAQVAYSCSVPMENPYCSCKLTRPWASAPCSSSTAAAASHGPRPSSSGPPAPPARLPFRRTPLSL